MNCRCDINQSVIENLQKENEELKNKLKSLYDAAIYCLKIIDFNDDLVEILNSIDINGIFGAGGS